jgi:hypothetical protein
MPRNEFVGVVWVKCTPSVIWVTADEGEVVLPRGLLWGLVTKKFSNVQIARRPTSLDLFTHLLRTGEPVETVATGPIGSLESGSKRPKRGSRHPKRESEEDTKELFNRLRSSRKSVGGIMATVDLLHSGLAVLEPRSRGRGFGHRTGRRTRNWRTEA